MVELADLLAENRAGLCRHCKGTGNCPTCLGSGQINHYSQWNTIIEAQVDERIKNNEKRRKAFTLELNGLPPGLDPLDVFPSGGVFDKYGLPGIHLIDDRSSALAIRDGASVLHDQKVRLIDTKLPQSQLSKRQRTVQQASENMGLEILTQVVKGEN